jgi:hypothetical protein
MGEGEGMHLAGEHALGAERMSSMAQRTTHGEAVVGYAGWGR